MVKKGEYFDYAIDLYNRIEEFDISVPEMYLNLDSYYPTTVMSIILECVNRIKELELKIIELEKK